jgi:hypothetical protein
MFDDSITSRRSVLAGAMAMAVAPMACAQQSMAGSYPTFDELGTRLPQILPQLRIALEVLAEVGEAYSLGQGPTGERRIVPIIGGQFRGESLSGVVLPGGADRQLIRVDGIRELDATYELKADDGTVVMVRNRVIVDAHQAPEGWDRYVRSVVELIVPKGPHDWLNRRVIVGTLHSMRPARPLVLLRFYVVE